MSNWLKGNVNQRLRFRATFERKGKKTAYRGPPIETILLKDVIVAETGRPVRDHVWLNMTKGFQQIGPLEQGQRIEFDARVTRCKKGYWGANFERALNASSPHYGYQLSRPTRICKVGGDEQ